MNSIFTYIIAIYIHTAIEMYLSICKYKLESTMKRKGVLGLYLLAEPIGTLLFIWSWCKSNNSKKRCILLSNCMYRVLHHLFGSIKSQTNPFYHLRIIFDAILNWPRSLVHSQLTIGWYIAVPQYGCADESEMFGTLHEFQQAQSCVFQLICRSGEIR